MAAPAVLAQVQPRRLGGSWQYQALQNQAGGRSGQGVAVSQTGTSGAGTAAGSSRPNTPAQVARSQAA